MLIVKGVKILKGGYISYIIANKTFGSEKKNFRVYKK